MIEGETIFRSTNDENERRQLFEDYIIDLKKAHKEQQVTMRKSAMDGLIELLPNLNLEPYTRWSEAQGAIQNTAPFQNDEKYKSLTKYDVLTVFQNHVKALERKFNDSLQEDKNKRLRRDRKARDNFIALLSELKKDGKIKAGTKWTEIHPLIESEEPYVAMAGHPGSTAMELFWDVVEEEERALRSIRNDVLDAIDVSWHPTSTAQKTVQLTATRINALRSPRKLRSKSLSQSSRVITAQLTLNATPWSLFLSG